MSRVAIALAAGSCLLVVSASWAWARSQTTALRAREAAAHSVAEDARQVLSLRSLRQRASMGERPRQDLITRINETMSAVGIPRGALGGVTTDTDGPISSAADLAPGGELRAQAMRVALKGIQPQQLGAFLEHWRETQPLWTPTNIEMSRAPSKDAAPGAERFDISLVLSVLYVAPSNHVPAG
ncbi:MAG: hypothetical protein KF724_13355 [Phycisphaeraceae bacterium]|nr:hypothetical protein [Phycisphaeraceae bacterium]